MWCGKNQKGPEIWCGLYIKPLYEDGTFKTEWNRRKGVIAWSKSQLYCDVTTILWQLFCDNYVVTLHNVFWCMISTKFNCWKVLLLLQDYYHPFWFEWNKSSLNWIIWLPINFNYKQLSLHNAHVSLTSWFGLNTFYLHVLLLLESCWSKTNSKIE